MRKILLLLSVVYCGILSSCSSMQLLSFDQLKPAEISIPEEVTNVAVVNNMPPAAFDKLSFIKSTERIFEGIGSVYTKALAEALAEGEYFDKIMICDSLLYQDDGTDEPYHMLDADQVSQLANDLDVDMIISVDRLSIHTGIGVAYDEMYGMPIDAVNAGYITLLHLYVPSKGKPIMRMAHRDSLQFELSLDLTNEFIAKETSSFAGYKEADKVIPYWKEVQRVYYDGGFAEFRDAGVALRDNNLEEAHRLWQKIYETKKGKNKVHAAYNIALYYEMTDELDKAVEWLERASSLLGEKDGKESNLISYYLAAVKTRQLELNKLEIQMGRFNDKNTR